MNSGKLLARAAEHWPAKVLSIALAIILFVFHRMSTLEDRIFSVPLRVEINNTFVPASPYTRMIRVTLRGDAASINPILEDDIEAYIDLRKYDTEGWYRAPVQIRKSGTALGVEPLEISVEPMEISLQLDHKISKKVPITANLQGNVESGYDLVSHALSPTEVVVDGPLSVIGDISELYTDFIDLEGRNADFSVTVNILNRDPLIVIRGNGLTDFHGFIRKPVPVRNFDEVPIIITGLNRRFEAELDIGAGTVRIEGGQNQLDLFVPPPDFLTVDCSSIVVPGAYTLPVALSLPSGLNIVRRSPLEAVLTVKVKGGSF
ncbi:MAG: hypothetical protein LBN21_03610 [Treponema sp.]|nr:hypothetical protein [Treponema sp.]